MPPWKQSRERQPRSTTSDCVSTGALIPRSPYSLGSSADHWLSPETAATPEPPGTPDNSLGLTAEVPTTFLPAVYVVLVASQRLRALTCRVKSVAFSSTALLGDTPGLKVCGPNHPRPKKFLLYGKRVQIKKTHM